MTRVKFSDTEEDLTTSDNILEDTTTINYHEESEDEELHIIYPETFIQSETTRDLDSTSVWDAPPTPALDYPSTQAPRTESDFIGETTEQQPGPFTTLRDEESYSSDQGLGVVIGRYNQRSILHFEVYISSHHLSCF